jgi:phage shock protein A
MEEGLDAARQQAVTVVTGERRLTRELERAQQAAAAWKTRARLALDHEREDLARRALARHLEQADLAQALQGQCAAARQTSAEVQAAVHALEDRLEHARRQQRLLHARQQAVHIHAEALATRGDGNPRSPFARFARLESKLADLEDDLLAYAAISSPSRQLDSEVMQLEGDQRLAAALAALKKEKD